jgi:hypothetical protein
MRIARMSQPQGFFQRRPLRRALYNWLERHQHPFNRGIHLIGIPLACAGVVLVFAWWDEWYWGVLAIAVGYLLQWIGHLVEGNDLGEWAGIKRFFGLPYVAISPRFQKPPPPDSPPC